MQSFAAREQLVAAAQRLSARGYLVATGGNLSLRLPGAAAFAIAARERDPVHGRALLLGAAVLDQLRDLEIWLGRDRTEDQFEDWRPDRLLTGLLETDGGYLEPALT